ncbi:PEP-CTERM sorting domain-containing protein [Massilia pseudoviolaceinigra]|uniref:PEP-CTERM sorting domain-containing protein n=1 Tax=Massilia pseudoviolaceinigra TaxID=3057165 RepID=UPI0027964EDD|nr:PEP-CTERM sorting domain-containing protein [Massilia sp. CCM 9206]MDQ1923338.1 PEP-CTERM sorting domain-containing protein [Massilia sp. CCM 9206]
MKSHIAGLIVGLTLTSFAQAQVVVLDFTATVASIKKEYGTPESGPAYMMNGALMSAGYTLRGTLSIDLNTRLPGGSAMGNYSYAFYEDNNGVANNGTRFSVDQTGYAYSSGPKPGTSFGVFDHVPGTGSDQFSASFMNGTDPANGKLETSETASFSFEQADGKMLGGHNADGLPLLPAALNFAGFSSATLNYRFADYINLPGSSHINSGYLVSANITSLALHSTSPVPEPSAYLMLGAGTLVLGTSMRRRQRQGRKD